LQQQEIFRNIFRSAEHLSRKLAQPFTYGKVGTFAEL
jgi:hypothetical protein